MFKRTAALMIIAAAMARAMPAKAAAQPLDLTAKAAILVERTTGKQLYGKNEKTRMYPASMTKIITALVALDYMAEGEFIVLGEELRETPRGSSVAYLVPGETILVENLLRGLLIMSGNEAGCAIAYNVALRHEPGGEMPYEDAEAVFSELMNAKAKELGAVNSHFTNPHGFHDDGHYSCAYDVALFSKAFLAVPLLAKIVNENAFEGNGAGDNPPEGAMTQVHSDWVTHNKLIMEGEEGYYTYANGIKTGFTDEAGNCVAASAKKDGVELISVVFFSPEPGVWNDSKALMEYGFNNFSFVDVQKPGDMLESAVIGRPRLGAPATLDVLGMGGFMDFYSKDEAARIRREVVYDVAFMDGAGEPPPGAAVLAAPIEKGAVLGKVNYYLDGEAIFVGDAVAASGALKRTWGSDFHYYWEMAKKHMFVMSAFPYWLGGAAILAALIVAVAVRRGRRGRKRGFSMYR